MSQSQPNISSATLVSNQAERDAVNARATDTAKGVLLDALGRIGAGEVVTTCVVSIQFEDDSLVSTFVAGAGHDIRSHIDNVTCTVIEGEQSQGIEAPDTGARLHAARKAETIDPVRIMTIAIAGLKLQGEDTTQEEAILRVFEAVVSQAGEDASDEVIKAAVAADVAANVPTTDGGAGPRVADLDRAANSPPTFA